VAEIVSNIARASTEQAEGIDQVNKALTQMDAVTQQNSALVQENAATAQALEQQAAAMTGSSARSRSISRRMALRFNRRPRRLLPFQRNLPRCLSPLAPRLRRAPTALLRGPVGRIPSKLATALKADATGRNFRAPGTAAAYCGSMLSSSASRPPFLLLAADEFAGRLRGACAAGCEAKAREARNDLLARQNSPTSRFMRCTTSAGTPTGATSTNQPSMVTPGTVSLMVGRSGSGGSAWSS